MWIKITPAQSPKTRQVSTASQHGISARHFSTAFQHGISLCVVKLDEAKRGFVLLPKRWVHKCVNGIVERAFGWASRFRRLARDYERLTQTLAGIHFVVFAGLMLTQLGRLVGLDAMATHTIKSKSKCITRFRKIALGF